MLKIQEFISCFSSIKEANTYLSRELSLKIEDGYLYGPKKSSRIYTYNKCRYSDINSSLVREANGLVLGEDCSLITKGPNHHYKIKRVKDLPENFRLYRSKAEEITTGITVTVFNCNGVWHIADKYSINDVDYSIDVKRAIGNHVEGCWSSIFDEQVNSPVVFKNHIYVFDFISNTYEKVWPCSASKLYLLTIINGKTGLEFAPHKVDKISEHLGFVRPNHREITGKRSLASFVAKAKIPTEGVMLTDKDTKVKISNSLHYSVKYAIEARENIRPIHIAKIFLACKDRVDLMVIASTFPNYNDFLYLFEKTIDKTWKDLIIIWNSVKEFSKDLKTFANAVPTYPLSHLLFMYRDKKITSLLKGVKSVSARRLVTMTKERYEMEFTTNERHLEADYSYEDKSLSK